VLPPAAAYREDALEEELHRDNLRLETAMDPDEASILRKFGLEPDPVIEAYKEHVDRTLLRQNLRRTPEERWRILTEALRLAEEVRRAGAAARGR
jgi:hypothetical protein